MLGSDQAAVDEIFMEARYCRNEDDDLRDISGDELLPVSIGTVEQRRAWRGRFDHALAGRARCNRDAVTARQVAALAASDAIEQGGIGQLDQMASPVTGDDQAVKQSELFLPARH